MATARTIRRLPCDSAPRSPRTGPTCKSCAELRADVTLTGAPLTSIPAVAALQAGILDKLAELPLLDKLADLLSAFTAWLDHLPQALADAVTDALPASLPAVPLPFDEVRFTIVGRDVLALVSLWGAYGDEHAVTRSPNSTAPPPGPRPDRWASLSRTDLMLRGARAALDPLLPNAGWRAPHPCHWRANHRLATVQDIGVDLTWVLGSVDEAGLLRLEVRFAGSHAGGGFGLTGSATFAIGVNDTFDAFVIDEPHLASLDVWVAWWVYALMAVGGGPIGVLVYRPARRLRRRRVGRGTAPRARRGVPRHLPAARPGHRT